MTSKVRLVNHDMDIVTLGMFIIDEIHFEDGRPPVTNVLGGAGTFVVLGARMFRKGQESKRIGWVVHRGSDFPKAIEREIDTWQTTCHYIDTPARLTTRGLNVYGAHEARAFKYQTEKLQVQHAHLTDAMVQARCFHLICAPDRCIALVKEILRSRQGSPITKPLFVWEPSPDSCVSGQLPNLLDALQYVDVVSPNHAELARLTTIGTSQYSKQDVIQGSTKLMAAFSQGKGAVIVRCGEHGCYIAAPTLEKFLPAYHQCSANVVDPTGAGNAFMGGLCIGMLDAHVYQQNRYLLGCIHGSVAAGCAVEQIGFPSLSIENEELWNGISIHERKRRYEIRLSRLDYAEHKIL